MAKRACASPRGFPAFAAQATPPIPPPLLNTGVIARGAPRDEAISTNQDEERVSARLLRFARNDAKRNPLMDFMLSNEQHSWQMAARKFADEEIRPISLQRDEISTAAETWDWDIIKK